MKSEFLREKLYDESFKPIDHDVIARYNDPGDTMVPVSCDHFTPVRLERYYKDIIEKHIEIKYRRFSFKESGFK